jgi:hypothetical protein
MPSVENNWDYWSNLPEALRSDDESVFMRRNTAADRRIADTPKLPTHPPG